jgi:G3E family GTPase
VITGFLGSGKSSLLSRCIREPGMDKTVVVVNEFGEVGLDHLLVTKGGDDTILLDSGCLCCLGNDLLQDTLMLLHSRRKRAEIPAFERVVIETSGLADPVPLLETLLADPVTTRNYRLASIVTVVDGKLGATELEAYPEARKQVRVADLIVLTKEDIATPEELQAATSSVRELNEVSPIVRLQDNQVPVHEALGFSLANAPINRGIPLSQSTGSALYHHDHTHGINSHVLRDFPIGSWQAYASWIKSLRSIDAARLLRTKGLVRFEDGLLYVIQGVRHVFSGPALYEGPAQEPFMVMIVRDLDRASLLKTFPPENTEP